MQSHNFMHKFITVLSAFFSVFIILGNSTYTVNASQVSVQGLDAADATITDAKTGKVESSNSQLDKFGAYNVSYNWSIQDGITINNGDTTTFTIPNNVQVVQDETCNVYDQNKQIVGTATIKAGSHTGTITFNNILGNKTGREGTLQVGVTGTYVNNNSNNNTPNSGASAGQGNTTDQGSGIGQAPTINKVGWYDKNNSKLAWWQIVANMNNADLKNPIITDNMGAGMQLVPGSLTVKEGNYVNGTFEEEKDITSQCSVTTNGSEITVKLPAGTTDQTIAVEYQTKMISDESSYTNSAVISADNVSQKISNSATLPGNIKATATYYQGKISVRKVDAETGEVLPGASFTLFGDHHQALKTEKTDANGIAIFNNLANGTYYVKETGAPAGYAIDSNYQKVTLDSSVESTTITVKDQKLPVSSSSLSVASSSSSKSSSSNKNSSSKLSSESKSLIIKNSSVSRTSISSRNTERLMSSTNKLNKNTEGSHNQGNKGSNHNGEGLPQTGEATATAIIGLGIVLIVISGVVVFNKKN